MARVLILGGTGMLGHKLWQSFRNRFDTYVTVRGEFRKYASLGLFEAERTVDRVDAFNMDSVMRAVATAQPDVIINCIGIVKQLEQAQDPIVTLTINSLFPHRLAAVSQVTRARLIHISTDCVFSGRKGMYSESDVSDAVDLYGRTKYLGEVSANDCLTLRTSIIGRQIMSTTGLVEWFLSSRSGEPVRGYRQAIFSGFTTIAFAEILSRVTQHYADLTGLYHVSSAPINKYDLLELLRISYRLNTALEADDAVAIDRSLDSSRFWSEVNFKPPPWEKMIRELANDPTPYRKWRGS